MEEKIMENIIHIRDHSNSIKEKQSRRLGLKRNNNNFYYNYNNITNNKYFNKRLLQDSEDIDPIYNGKDEIKVYVYIASDNEVVKEAFTKYLLGHKNIAGSNI
jgi:hypothetical protein